MLTAITQEAIRLLRYIYYRDTSCGCPYHPADCIFEDASVLLLQLEGGGLVRCVCREAPDKPESYELCKPLESVNLLSLLLILNEGVHPGFSRRGRTACLRTLWGSRFPYGCGQPDDAQHLR